MIPARIAAWQAAPRKARMKRGHLPIRYWFNIEDAGKERAELKPKWLRSLSLANRMQVAAEYRRARHPHYWKQNLCFSKLRI
jgi:hypothetical protein